MSDKNKFFHSTVKRLLNERLSQAEEQSLKDEGYELKNPTRKTAVMIALYKKASGGDLAAIKELRAIVNEDDGVGEKSSCKAVMIIDDIGN